jgi:hypothetical protein
MKLEKIFRFTCLTLNVSFFVAEEESFPSEVDFNKDARMVEIIGNRATVQ